MYKVVFFDVDGTLLSEVDRMMLPCTREAIKRLIDQGIEVVVATGRPYSMCQEFKALGIHTFISANGALVKSRGETIYKSLLGAEMVREVAEFAQLNQQGLAFFTELFSMNGMGSQDERMLTALHDTLSLTQYPPTIDPLLEEVYCMCLYADHVEEQKFVERFPHLRFHRFHDFVSNILEEREVSKSMAIKQVLEHFNIDRSEAIAFGDGGNDIDMLEYVGLGIAMGNGGEVLKRSADFVTKRASEGGISYALQQFGVI
jgi:Cof subfamily protein (haloacid dehalogenase superfamily)